MSARLVDQAAAARSFLLTNWVTIRGSSTVLSVTQDAEEWLQLPSFADATFYVDVAEVTPPSGASVGLVLLYLETAPTPDESLFQTVAGPIVCTASTASLIVKTASGGATPLCRYVRWRAVATFGASWDLTMRVRVVGNRSAYFAPTQLGGCSLWLRTDLAVSFTLNKVSQWNDQSGNANHAVQATSTRQPGYNVNAPVNGQSTIFFDPSVAGSEKYMNLTSSLASLTAAHAFVVHRRVSATETNNAKTGFWKLGTGPGTPAMPGTDGNIYDDCASTTSHTCGAPVVTLTTPQAYEVRSQAGSWANFLNGISQFSVGSNTVGPSSTPQIGANTTFPNYYNGDWCEMILFNRILATSERALLISYLNNRYALGAT